MGRVRTSFINKWFDEHGGDVFRCMQMGWYQEDLNTEPRREFSHVFITRIKNNFYVANERDIYNNGLGKFYSQIGMTSEVPKEKENYIRVYPASDTEKYATFVSFYDSEEGWTEQQNMPWFEEDRFNRMKFLADVYKAYDNN